MAKIKMRREGLMEVCEWVSKDKACRTPASAVSISPEGGDDCLVRVLRFSGGEGCESLRACRDGR